MKKSLSITTAVLILLICLTGCGGRSLKPLSTLGPNNEEYKDATYGTDSINIKSISASIEGDELVTVITAESNLAFDWVVTVDFLDSSGERIGRYFCDLGIISDNQTDTNAPYKTEKSTFRSVPDFSIEDIEYYHIFKVEILNSRHLRHKKSTS
jgi:hypothetical protein